MNRFTFCQTFHGIFEEYREHDGKEFIVLKHLEPEHEEDDIGMFEIRLKDTNCTRITAHPEEIVKTIDGQPYIVCGQTRT
jgi:hypothetical protein